MTEPASKKRGKSIASPIPTPIRQSVVVAGKLASGLDAKGSELGLKQASGEQIRTAIVTLTKTEDTYQAVLSSKTLTLFPAFKKADAEARKFIIDAKKVLSLPLGDAWNQSWSQAGFLNANLRSPVTVIDRIGTVEALARYFAVHPDFEVPNQGITAEHATQFHLALSKAHGDLELYDTRRKETRAARDKANKALRKLAADVIVEIRRKLPIDSPLWDTFGLTAPKPRAPRPRKEKVAKRAKSGIGRTATPAADATVSLAS